MIENFKDWLRGKAVDLIDYLLRDENHRAKYL